MDSSCTKLPHWDEQCSQRNEVMIAVDCVCGHCDHCMENEVMSIALSRAFVTNALSKSFVASVGQQMVHSDWHCSGKWFVHNGDGYNDWYLNQDLNWVKTMTPSMYFETQEQAQELVDRYNKPIAVVDGPLRRFMKNRSRRIARKGAENVSEVTDTIVRK